MGNVTKGISQNPAKVSRGNSGPPGRPTRQGLLCCNVHGLAEVFICSNQNIEAVQVKCCVKAFTSCISCFNLSDAMEKQSFKWKRLFNEANKHFHGCVNFPTIVRNHTYWWAS